MTKPSPIEKSPDRPWSTMADVARHAGVSKITVSRVLREPGKVRADTRKRVLAAIRDLQYMPDENAGAFATGRSRMIGALISTLGGSTFESTVNGLSGTLAAAGYQLLLTTTDFSPAKEAVILPRLLARRPDGIVLTSTQHTRETRKLLGRAEIPVVELWELPRQPIHSAVGFSNRDAGQAMTRHLLDRGYASVGFIGARPGKEQRSLMRARGYEEALKASGLAPRLIPGAENVDAVTRGAQGLAALLGEWPNTRAVFCSSDQVAIGALGEARRRGIRVPEDLAIAGFGDFEFAGDNGLELTTVRIPGYEIGVRTAQLLADYWGLSEHREPASIDLGYEIVSRRTA